jgi:hypothetical protein
MDTKPQAPENYSSEIDKSTTDNVEYIQNIAQPNNNALKKSPGKKLVFLCLILPWVLIIGGIIVSSLINFIVPSLGLPESLKLVSNLFVILLGIIGIIWIPIGIIYFIIKISKN